MAKTLNVSLNEIKQLSSKTEEYQKLQRMLIQLAQAPSKKAFIESKNYQFKNGDLFKAQSSHPFCPSKICQQAI